MVLRKLTERSDCQGRNTVLAHDTRTARAFLSDPDRYRRAPTWPETSPSAVVAGELARQLDLC